MAKLVIIQPNGLMRFVRHLEKPWFFWRKRLALTPHEGDAMALSEDVFSNIVRIGTKCYHRARFEQMEEDDLALYTYYVVVCGKGFNHKLRYYDYDIESFDKRLKRRISKPHFCKDINKAEFIKSRKYADEVATRCRQEGGKFVAVREVYVYRENELLRRNIVVVLRHKKNKNIKPSFLFSYDMDKGNFIKASRYDEAARYTYDEFLDLYDNLHAVHKEYMILPKITDNVVGAIKAKDVDGKEMVEGTLRLRNK